MTFYERLQQETAAERNALLAVPIIGKALSGQVTLEQYIAFLTQAYHHVKHTSPLLMACGGRQVLRTFRLSSGESDGDQGSASRSHLA